MLRVHRTGMVQRRHAKVPHALFGLLCKVEDYAKKWWRTTPKAGGQFSNLGEFHYKNEVTLYDDKDTILMMRILSYGFDFKMIKQRF